MPEAGAPRGSGNGSGSGACLLPFPILFWCVWGQLLPTCFSTLGAVVAPPKRRLFFVIMGNVWCFGIFSLLKMKMLVDIKDVSTSFISYFHATRDAVGCVIRSSTVSKDLLLASVCDDCKPHTLHSISNLKIWVILSICHILQPCHSSLWFKLNSLQICYVSE